MQPQPISRPAIADIHALTSIRGIAAWWIVIYHFREVLPEGTPSTLMTLAGYGYLAVDLFFELSGFVIALNYSAKFHDAILPNMWQFLGLRLARIYPLHIFMLILFIANPIVILLFSTQGVAGYRYNIGYFLLSVILMQNWGFTSDLAWNIPAWSISTEWFAYLLFPVLVWVSSRLARSAAHAFGLALLLLIILAGTAYALGTGLGRDIQTFGLFRCVIEFWTGIFLYYLWNNRPGASISESNIVAFLSLVCLFVYPVLKIPDYTLMPLGFFLLIYSLSRDSGILARVLNNHFLQRIGYISYSTYLVHYFVKDWVKFLLVRPGVSYEVPFMAYIIVTAALSVVLYRFIEVPGRRALRSLIARGTSVPQPYTKPV